MQVRSKILDAKLIKLGQGEALYIRTKRGNTYSTDKILLELFHDNRIVGYPIVVECSSETTELGYNCMAPAKTINSRNR